MIETQSKRVMGHSLCPNTILRVQSIGVFLLEKDSSDHLKIGPLFLWGCSVWIPCCLLLGHSLGPYMVKGWQIRMVFMWSTVHNSGMKIQHCTLELEGPRPRKSKISHWWNAPSSLYSGDWSVQGTKVVWINEQTYKRPYVAWNA